jgi:hypothetical protein
MTDSSFREEDLGRYQVPSGPLSVEMQLITKLASLESAVSAGFRRLDEKMDRFQNDLHDSQIATNDRINNLDKETTASFALKRARIDAAEKRLNTLETWTQVAMAKISVVTTVIAIVWIVAAPTIRNILGISPG